MQCAYIEILPFLLAASLGFRHAFEADHLVAVGNIVKKHNSTYLAMKDGTYWGIGHTISILIIGLIMLFMRWVIPDHYFKSMEGAIGVMIICVGVFHLWRFFKNKPLRIHKHEHTHNGETHNHLHVHTICNTTHPSASS